MNINELISGAVNISTTITISSQKCEGVVEGGWAVSEKKVG